MDWLEKIRQRADSVEQHRIKWAYKLTRAEVDSRVERFERNGYDTEYAQLYGYAVVDIPTLIAALEIANKSLEAICNITNDPGAFEDQELALKINHLCADFLAWSPEELANANS